MGFVGIIIRDLKRLWIDRIRLVSGLGQPLLYLFILGSGVGAATTLGGDQYLRYIFPGVVGLSLLFSATFAAISIVFDREVGFLKAILVAPVSRREVALGKIVSGALQALLQAILLLVFAPLVGLHLGLIPVIGVTVFMIICGLVFSAMGVAVAARFTSAEVFPIVLNAVLLPMFFISGALFPLTTSPKWLQMLAYIDPVAYGVDLMRGAILGTYYFPVGLSLVVLTVVFIVLTWIAIRVFERGEEVE